MTAVIGPTEAAHRLGISREALLSWERRYGFPKPDRLPNGSRRYSEQLVRALGVVIAERESGVPLGRALEQARHAMESSAASSGVRPAITSSVMQEVLDRIDSSVVIMSGHNYVIEFANATHRRLYPGSQLVGQPALDILSHSNQYFDLAGVLAHVMSSGETLRWASQLVPIFGEERWASFSYGRLSLGEGAVPHVLLMSLDVTEHVLAVREAQALAAEATRVAEVARRQVALLDLLMRTTERIAEGADSFDGELLTVLQRGFLASGVSAWLLTDHSWRRITVTGGGGKQLPGFEHDRRLSDVHPHISGAMRAFSVTRVSDADFWLEASLPAERWCLVVPVVAPKVDDPRAIFLLFEGLSPDHDELGERILRTLGMLLGKVS